jgi:type II secretory pathway pseudopilin PulG
MSSPLIAGGSLLLKGLGSIFGTRSKNKQQAEQNRAAAAGLAIQQKRGEDERRARLQLGNSLLGGVPSTTAGGGVNTNVGLDPELVKSLGLERTYDFGSAMPKPGAGGIDAFLAGLFGGAADTLPYTNFSQQQPDSGATFPAGFRWPGGAANNPNSPAAAPTVGMDDLMKLIGSGGGLE